MRRPRTHLFIFLSILFITSLLIIPDIHAAGRTYKAELTGGDMVPAANTEAKGTATFGLSDDGNELAFTLTLEDIEDVTAAHIHEGDSCSNNPPIVNLFVGRKKEGKFNGTLSEGTITESDLMRSLKDKPLKDLIEMIEAGNAFVNVHTGKYPAGELRGRIKKKLIK